MSVSDICPVCRAQPEDIFHLFTQCPELASFKASIVNMLETLFQNVSPQKLNVISIDRLIILGFQERWKCVNGYLVNFLLCVARFCIYKRRNMMLFNEGRVPILRFFKYTAEKFIKYAFSHFHSNQNIALFKKYFVNHSNYVSVAADSVRIKFDI